MLSMSPLLVLIWAIVTLLNLPLPPFISFMGELYIFYSLILYSPFSLLCIIFIVLYRVVICCYLYSSLVHSNPLFHTPTPPPSPIDLGVFFIPLYITLLLIGGLGFSPLL
jgi:hypothetical protein